MRDHLFARGALALLVIGACQNAPAPAASQDPGMIGLVELPGLFGSRDPEGPPGVVAPARVRPVPVFAGPDSSSARIATVSSPDSIEWREADYEAPAAVAYGEDGGWVRVALPDAPGRRYGWVPPEHRGVLHHLATLLEEGLVYLTSEWDGVLRETASADAPGRSVDRLAPDGRADARVIRSVRAGGATWLEVEVLGPGRCEATEPPPVVATGWVPALARDGRPNAWYYSRGC